MIETIIGIGKIAQKHDIDEFMLLPHNTRTRCFADFNALHRRHQLNKSYVPAGDQFVTTAKHKCCRWL